MHYWFYFLIDTNSAAYCCVPLTESLDSAKLMNSLQNDNWPCQVFSFSFLIQLWLTIHDALLYETMKHTYIELWYRIIIVTNNAMAFTPCGNDRVSLYTSLGNVHHTVSVFCQDADVAAAAIILKTFNFVGNNEHFRAFERTFQSHYFSFRKYLYTIFRRFRISLWSVGLSIARYWQPTTEMWGAFIWAEPP